MSYLTGLAVMVIGAVANWFWSSINNGVLEGINSLIQAAKARGPWLSLQAQPDHHALPHRWQAHYPFEIARSLKEVVTP